LELAPLAAGHKKRVQEQISRGINFQWDSERLKNYVEQLGTLTVDYQDQVDELVTFFDQEKASLDRLVSCAPNKESFVAIIAEIQSVVDHLDKRGFSNLGHWVGSLDAMIEETLVKRLQSILDKWIEALDVDTQQLQTKLQERTRKREQRQKEKEKRDKEKDKEKEKKRKRRNKRRSKRRRTKTRPRRTRRTGR